jgi:hypothetical protein
LLSQFEGIIDLDSKLSDGAFDAGVAKQKLYCIPLPEDRMDEQTSEDKFEELIGAAVWAPSSHNTQPWVFQQGPDAIRLFADRKPERSRPTIRMSGSLPSAAVAPCSTCASLRPPMGSDRQ